MPWDGAEGKNPDMFFKDPDKIALEIGPFIPEKIFKKERDAPCAVPLEAALISVT